MKRIKKEYQYLLKMKIQKKKKLKPSRNISTAEVLVLDTMLDILYDMAKVLTKPSDQEFRNTPKEIERDSRYMPHFKVSTMYSIMLFFLYVNHN